MKKGILSLISIFLFCGCTMLASDRTFLTEMDKETDGFFVAGQDFPIIPGDSGKAYRSRKEIYSRTPMNRRDKEDLKKMAILENELQSLEDSLSNKDYQHYLKYYHYLSSISEKIYFLKLEDKEEREDYLMSKGFSPEKDYSKKYDRTPFDSQFAIKGHEIFIGMSKNEVIQSWGRPIRIDIAGNPRNENERWIFYGENGHKYVFFEEGAVQGWVLE